MGLDIHLETKQEHDESVAWDKKWSEFYATGPSDEDMTEWRKKNPYPSSRHEDKVKSKLWPEHFFNRRYLRSSYNSAGFDRIVPELVTADLGFQPSFYGIFEPLQTESRLLGEHDIEALQLCATRAKAVAEALRTSDKLSVTTVAHNQFLPPPTTSDIEALAWYRDEVRKGQIKPEGWWSNKDGHVFGTEGMTILAAVPGSQFGSPCVHLIGRMPHIDFYAQGADITAEFCDEAVELIDKDGAARLIWSG